MHVLSQFWNLRPEKPNTFIFFTPLTMWNQVLGRHKGRYTQTFIFLLFRNTIHLYETWMCTGATRHFDFRVHTEWTGDLVEKAPRDYDKTKRRKTTENIRKNPIWNDLRRWSALLKTNVKSLSFFFFSSSFYFGNKA